MAAHDLIKISYELSLQEIKDSLGNYVDRELIVDITTEILYMKLNNKLMMINSLTEVV